MNDYELMTIFAHQDDETFSAGGILAKYANSDKAIAVSVTADPKREQEFKDACDIIGTDSLILNNENVSPINMDQIRGNLIEVIRKYRPNHIITHVEFDYHHEHRMVRKIVEEAVEWASHTTSGEEAFQVKSLWAAETTVLIPVPEVLIDITKYNSQRLDAIDCYETQSHKGGDGFYSKFHNTRTKLRGIQAGVDHAEAFVQIPIFQTGSFKPTKVMKKLPF